jgi:hypothetical protein
MQSVVSICPSSDWRNLHNDTTCTTHRRASDSLEVRLENPSHSCFTPKQAVRSRRVPRRHPSIGFVMQSINISPFDFKAQINKASRFWGINHQTGAAGFEPQIRKSSTFSLRLNQEIRVLHLLVHGTDHTQCHPISWSSDHRVTDLCLSTPGPMHQVFYSCHDPHRYLPCYTCHIYTTR